MGAKFATGRFQFKTDFAGYWDGEAPETRVLLGIPTVDIASSDIPPEIRHVKLGVYVSLDTAYVGRCF
jgi:hypothetical protein